MQELQEIQNYHTPVNPQSYFVEVSGTNRLYTPEIIVTPETPIEVGVNDDISPTGVRFLRRYVNLHTFHFDTPPRIESPKLAEYLLIRSGIQHATSLVHIFDELIKYNSDAIYRIVSILEHYIKAIEELDLDMSPTTSIRISANVVDKGIAEPDFYLE